MPTTKSVLCISWDPCHADARLMMLMQAGYVVISALGREEASLESHAKADLLVLGQSVPEMDKQTIIRLFRKHSQAPILSLLERGHKKLPEADLGAEVLTPTDFVKVVKEILPP